MQRTPKIKCSGMSWNMLYTIKVRFFFAGYIFVQILLSYMQMKIILVHQETSKQKGGLHYLYAFKWPFQYISHFMRKPTIWSKFSICTFLFKNCFHVLRVYQTLIMWLRSLSAILPLFWRHDITNFLTFAAKTCEILFWRHEIHNIIPRNRTNALQN